MYYINTQMHVYARNLPFIPRQRPIQYLDIYFDRPEKSLNDSLTSFCHFRNKPKGLTKILEYEYKIGQKEMFLFGNFPEFKELVETEENGHFLPFIQDLINTILLYRSHEIEIGESHDVLFVFYPYFRSYALWMSFLFIKFRRRTSSRRSFYFFNKTVECITLHITYETRSKYSPF